jgi:hypothetical protein
MDAFIQSPQPCPGLREWLRRRCRTGDPIRLSDSVLTGQTSIFPRWSTPRPALTHAEPGWRWPEHLGIGKPRYSCSTSPCAGRSTTVAGYAPITPGIPGRAARTAYTLYETHAKNGIRVTNLSHPCRPTHRQRFRRFDHALSRRQRPVAQPRGPGQVVHRRCGSDPVDVLQPPKKTTRLQSPRHGPTGILRTLHAVTASTATHDIGHGDAAHFAFGSAIRREPTPQPSVRLERRTLPALLNPTWLAL